MAPCQHPYEKLLLEASPASSQGLATSFLLTCKECKRRWPAAKALELQSTSMLKQVQDLWQAVEKLGGKRPDPPLPPKLAVAKKEEPCLHHRGWLRFHATGGEAFSINCVGCKRGWGGGEAYAFVMLKVFAELDEVQKQLRVLKAAAETAEAAEAETAEHEASSA